MVPQYNHYIAIAMVPFSVANNLQQKHLLINHVNVVSSSLPIIATSINISNSLQAVIKDRYMFSGSSINIKNV